MIANGYSNDLDAKTFKTIIKAVPGATSLSLSGKKLSADAVGLIAKHQVI